VHTITLEDHGKQTKWTLVARFDSLEDRDITARMGFGAMIGQGLERMAEYLGTLRRPAAASPPEPLSTMKSGE
jgi:uncharacterized protein YndB with AHSA1/START domain